MTGNTSFNPSVLAAVKPDIDNTLTEIAARLQQYFNEPESNESMLQVALDESSRLTDMLKNSGLDGVTVFCSELVCALGELGTNQEQVSDAQHEVFHRALSAIREYLVILTGGAKNAALRLFPQYQELKKMRGQEAASELDLFYPDLAVSLPEYLLGSMSEGDNPENLKALRSNYQQALLRWLRQDDASNASLQMLQALEGVMRCVPQDDGRAFWWASCGLLDCIKHDGLPPELNARKLLGRVDQQIRTVAEGINVDVRPVLNEILYLIARSHVVSPLVEEIKQVYALDDYLPELLELLPDVQESMIGDMRDRLLDAKKCWERGVKGDAAACAQFFRHAEQLVEYSENLERDSLHHLAKHILKLSEYINKSEHARLVDIDMAMALLLLEAGIKNSNFLDDNFKEQADILSERMHVAIKQQPEDMQQLDKLIDLHFQMTEQGEVMNTLLNEMLANHQHVEHGLNAYFSNAIQRSELAGLLRLLGQIRGGLSILSLDVASHLLLSMETAVLRFAQTQNMPDAEEKDTIVDAMSGLESYLRQLASAKRGDVSQLEKISAELVRQQHAAESAVSMPSILPQKDLSMTTASPSESSLDMPEKQMSDEDQKLIDIFLEEAREVLGVMRANIEICQLHPNSIEPLVTIRRGFHTLKGSGRMVGLAELGEVAWCVERAMNNWLQAKKPATDDLLKFVNTAVQAFSGWVDVLESQGELHIEAGELKTVAQKIEDGQAVGVILELISPKAESATTPTLEFELDEVETSESAALPDMPVTESITQENLEPKIEVEVGLQDLEFTSEIETTTESSSAHESETGLESSLESVQEVVRVGDIALSQSLFNIASTEAVHNMAILQAQFDGLATETKPSIKHDFMRAAHTLVGLNQTMGFEAIVDLASALECWLQVREGQTFSLGKEQRKMLEDAIAALGEMVSNICNQHMPQSHGDLANQLRADVDNFTTDQPQSGPMPNIRLETPADDKHVENQDEPGEPLVQDEIDEQLLPVFLEEAEELYPKINECLRELRKQPQDDKQEQSLKRLLHTLKGSSRMVGAMRIGDIAHAMEDQLSAAAKASEVVSYRDALERNFDLANALLEELRGGEVAVMPGEIEAGVERGRRASDKLGGGKTDRRSTDQSIIVSGNVLRMRSELVDKLVSDAGEISVARSRIETELHTFKDGLIELSSSVVRLRQQLREVEIQAETQMQSKASLARNNEEGFDPLELDRFTRLQELTRFMNESVHDVQTVRYALLKNMEETSVVLQMQGRIIRELHQNLMNVRMVSFSSIADRLYRIVRQTGKELEKRVNLELTGMTVELDRSMLEKMVAPFEHLLRNAIVHGLESDQARVQAGKLPIGEIRLSVRQEVNEVIFDFSDDGAGLDYVRLQEKAIASGLLSAEHEVSEDQLAQLIFLPGLSTATEVTESAGRGIGMDVVRSEIAALGGTINVQSRSGLGTRFIIRMPLTLAVTQIVLARSGGTTYAIPSIMVDQVRQLKSADMISLNNERKIEWRESTYPLHYLSQLLTDTPIVQENHLQNQVLLLRSGEERIALHVDELLGNQEAIVKNIGIQLSRLSGIAGATVIGTGVVVLILNPLQLAHRVSTRSGKAGAAEPSANVNMLTSLPLIMVVDDSLTVRKISTRMLKRAGYQVVTASDGVDALEQLENFTPDVMLLDIEMPRMDGFELASELRTNPKTANLPIIMITSRTADKHREYAMELGVNAYLGKPYQENELLEKIAAYVPSMKVHKK